MSHIEMEMREAIVAFLPGAIAAALLSYSRFLEEQTTREEQPDAKSFKAHHDACKVAIAHIELLVKLASALSEGTRDCGVDTPAMAILLKNAQAEVDEHEPE